MVYNSRYLDPLVIYAFQRIFTSASSKEILIAFLNAALDGQRMVVEVMYNEVANVGLRKYHGDDSIDILCTDVYGDSFFIGLQILEEAAFPDDPLQYGIKLIQEQKRTDQLVYSQSRKQNGYMVVLVVNRIKGVLLNEYRHEVRLHLLKPEAYVGLKLNLIFIGVSQFHCGPTKLKTALDKWVFLLKHLNQLEALPLHLCEPVFEQVLALAEYAKLTAEEQSAYLMSSRERF